MYLITYKVTPMPSHPDFDELGGAYVNCYIVAETYEEAETLAQSEVKENLWIIEELDEATRLDSVADVQDDKIEYYEQALLDERVLVFYTYSKEEKST